MTQLNFNDRERIQKEVLLGIEPATEDNAEQEAFRKRLTVETIVAKSKGIILDFQHDWDV